MSLNRITEGEEKKHYECQVCFVKKKHKLFFKLLPHPAIIKLLNTFEERTVCEPCAMREEFGSNYRQHPRYKEWVENRGEGMMKPALLQKSLHYGTNIELSQEDRRIIEDMSAAICKQDRSYFVNNYKKDKTVKLHEMNLNGFGAELAFCRLCEVEFDSSTIQKESHFNKVDATLKDGRTVDVKNTIYPSGKLIVRRGKEIKYVDIYALVVGKFPMFRFSGWANYKDIINPILIENLGWGDAYCLPQDSLKKSLKVD